MNASKQEITNKIKSAKNSWLDDNGCTWLWDGVRVYCLEAEEEMLSQGVDPLEVKNGYYADTEEEALQVLIDGGYIKCSTS